MRYLAADGTIFDSIDECKKYEETIATRLVGDIPHVIFDGEYLFDGSPWNLYVFIRIENGEQLNKLQRWIRACGSELILHEDLIGHEIMVDCYNGIDDELDNISEIYSIETVEQNIARYVRRLENCTRLIGKENTK